MEQLLDCIMELGEQMLLSGAEVHRVEDSLQRMLGACGTRRTDVFIIPSSMVVTIHTQEGEVLTQTRRITGSSMDYERLHRLNALSREICEKRLPPEEIVQRLCAIEAAKPRPVWTEYLCYAVISGAFTAFFGGGPAEAGISFVIGAIVRLMMEVGDRTIRNRIFSKFLASLTATALTMLSVQLGLIPHADQVIIGAIMTLLPGIGLTTALKELFIGDSIAGLLRTIEACITALSIAAGYCAVVFLAGGVG